MPSLRVEANCSLLFTELPLLERPAAAAAAGFRAIELWWPFSVPVPTDAELRALEEAIGEAGVSLVGLNLDGGDMPAGDRGLAALPGMDARFADNLACVMAIAERCGVRVVNALYGNRIDGAAPEEQDEIALRRLVAASDAAAAVGVQIVVENQNRIDSPYYPLRTAAETVEIVRSVRAAAGRDNVSWLCDLYHLAMEGQDLSADLVAHAPFIGHVQVADAPGRHEPGSGDVDFRTVLGDLAGVGYAGWVGGEYRPTTATTDGLGWIGELADLLTT